MLLNGNLLMDSFILDLDLLLPLKNLLTMDMMNSLVKNPTTSNKPSSGPLKMKSLLPRFTSDKILKNELNCDFYIYS